MKTRVNLTILIVVAITPIRGTSTIPKHNNLIQAPRGGFSGPSMGGFNNLPVGDMAPITIMGHKA